MEPGRQTGVDLILRPRRLEASLWRRLRFEQEPACRERLFMRYQRIAAAIAAREFRRRPPGGLALDDYRQLAYEALLESIDRFDPLIGAAFVSFAKRRILGRIADGAAAASEGAAQHAHRRRAEADRLRSLKRDAPPPSGGERAALAELAVGLALGLLLDDAARAQERAGAADAYEDLYWRQIRLKVVEEIDRLPPLEAAIMNQHYLLDLPFSTIASLQGVSKGRVSQAHQSALRRLRERLKAFR